MQTAPNKMPRISVVVPSFNQGRFLRDALESIFRQEYPDLEVIVMDGGSTDDSVAIIRSYASRLTYWQSEKDGGQSAAINAGMRRATGDIVAWLNSDDYYWGDALWWIGNAYAEYPGHGLYVGNGLRFDQASGRYAPFCDRHIAFNRAALRHGTDYLLQPSTFFLRAAWEAIGGLDTSLSYCMDWDLFLRIADRYPVVVLQEHLSVSREYDDTKTKRGKMKRAAEIIRMVQAHTGAEVTPGSLLFLCETLLDVTAETGPQELRDHLHGAQKVLARHLSMQYGGGHGFPEQCDPQDKCYLPFAKESTAIRPRRFELSAAPAISIVVPVLSGDTGYQQTWASIDQQGYDNVEIVTCGSESLHHAAAINEGLDRARGEILGWLQPGDRLAAGALHEIARAFADDPDLDLVHGNAVHIDAAGSIYLADHGMHLSGVWTESHAASGNVACTGDVVAPFPQPTVFFRRRLLERCGNLDESLRFVYDWDLLARFAKCAKVKKIERIQAFQVAPVDSRNRHNARLIERYRVQRSTWPSVFSPEYPRVLRAFLKGYLRRKFSGRPPRWLYWSAAAFAALAATTRLANPERWWKYRLHIQAGPLWPAPQQKGKRFASIFLGPSLPRANAETPEEVREWQIVRGLSMNSSIEYFNLEQDARESDADSLVSYVDTIHNAKQLAAAFPEFVYPPAARPALRTRMINLLRRWNVPVAGPRYPLHVAEQLPFLRAYFGIIVRHLLHWNRPDFLFVCPQSNPMPLLLTAEPTDTRIIVVAHEVDTDRMESLARAATGLKRRALEAEARRTRTFERENLACCDGILAASESDRERFVSEYGMPAERVFVFTSQDDAGLLAFLARLKALPRRHDAASLPASRTYLRAA